jgi:hypothetical protein
MTLEELEAFITEKFGELATQVGGLESKILSEVDRRNSGTAASIVKDVTKKLEAFQPATPDPAPEAKPGESGDEAKGKLTVKAVQTELQQLRQEIADKNAAIERSNREAALSGVLSSKRVLAQGVLFNALKAQYGDKLQQDGDQWFVVDGDSAKTLESVVDGFLSTDDGKAFLPSSGVNGAGSKESNSTTSATSQDLSASQMLMAAVSGLG